jgi:hypothetical protein
MVELEGAFYSENPSMVFFEGEAGNEILMTAPVRERLVPFLCLDCYIDRGPVGDDRFYLKDGMTNLFSLLEKEQVIRLRINPKSSPPSGRESFGPKGKDVSSLIWGDRPARNGSTLLRLDLGRVSIIGKGSSACFQWGKERWLRLLFPER